MEIYRFIKGFFYTCFILLLLNPFNLSGQNIRDFTTDLPLIIIDTEGRTIMDEPKIMAKMKIISNDSKVNRYTDLPNVYNGYIGIEYRGRSSQNYPQKPFSIETRDVAGNNVNVSLLGMPKENDWVLISNYGDKSFMRNILGYELFRRLGNYASRSKLVEVILNNEYQGIYVFGEKIKEDKNRVNMATLKPEDNSGIEVTGGYIFKIDYWTSATGWESPYSPIGYPDYKVRFVYHDPDWDVITTQQKNYIKDYVTNFESILYSTLYNDEVQGYQQYIDVRSFIDYFLVNEISRNNDGFKKSCYFHKDKEGKIVAGPVWDFDWAWKNINECYIFRATDGSGWSYKVNDCNPDVKSPGWMVRLFYDDKFSNEVNCRYFEKRNTTLSNKAIFNMIDSLYNVVKSAQVRHFQKWQILGKNVGVPEIGTQPATYEGEVDKLKNWISIRLNWLDKNMPGRCTSVHTNQLADNLKLKIYPNPSNTNINLISSEKITSLFIYDVTGKLASKTENLNLNKITVPVSSFKKGVYMVKVFLADGHFTVEKFIVN